MYRYVRRNEIRIYSTVSLLIVQVWWLKLIVELFFLIESPLIFYLVSHCGRKRFFLWELHSTRLHEIKCMRPSLSYKEKWTGYYTAMTRTSFSKPRNMKSTSISVSKSSGAYICPSIFVIILPREAPRISKLPSMNPNES
jgi:hypothetical protein